MTNPILVALLGLIPIYLLVGMAFGLAYTDVVPTHKRALWLLIMLVGWPLFLLALNDEDFHP